jgi:hypothetical protein
VRTAGYSVSFRYSGPLYVLQVTVCLFGIADRSMYCRLRCQFGIVDHCVNCTLQCFSLV